MFLLDGQPISPDAEFVSNDVQYPAGWIRLATPEERAAVGITEVPDPPYYDQRFYWNLNVPKDHSQLVNQWIDQTRNTANTLLTPTDWMIVRESDNGTAADPKIKTWREELRLACNEKVLYIGTTNTTDELAAYITGAAYPIWPNDPYAPGPASSATTSDGVQSLGNQSTGDVIGFLGSDTITFSGSSTSSGISFNTSDSVVF